jgi:hypothetical protein
MDRLAEAEALIRTAERAIEQVESGYRASLDDHQISAELQIAIKNVVENLRSALDYSARAVYERIGGAPGPNVYFPIARPDARPADFPSRANKDVPGVLGRQDLVDYLVSVQMFSDPANDWLSKLATLATENKHENLTPQRRTQAPRTTVETAGRGIVSWGPGVTFGAGVSIGGVPVDPSTQLPVPHPSQRVRREVWVDFAFESTGDSVLAFLRQATTGVRSIVEGLAQRLI